MIKKPISLAKGHVLVPAAASASLALVLVAGLNMLGFLDRLDFWISAVLKNHGGMETTKTLSEPVVWLATGLFTFGLSLAILAVPGQWRRVVLWLTALFLVAAWAPVLSLASHAPAISAAWIASLWSGVCALVYAAKHQMPVDDQVHPGQLLPVAEK